MKKIYSLTLFLFLTTVTFAQTQFWVQFKDKGNNPYSLSNPSAYLSPRALARRATHGIPIDSLDLPVTPMYVAGVAAVSGVTVHSHSKWLNGVVVFSSNPSALATIAALPYVVSVSGVGLRVANPNGDKFVQETVAPVPQNAQRNGNVTSSSLNYGASFNQIDMLGGVCLHNAGFRGQGMQIAIIDAGFYHADVHPAFDTLFMNNRILGTWDFVAGDSSVYEDNPHGAEVLSCMGGNIPGQLVGTAPDASYWLLRSEEAATENLVEEYYWASAAEFADSVGADVINSSLGYNRFDDPSDDHTYADMNGHTTPCARAVNYAANKGIAVVVAAGNEGSNPWHFVGTPADADSALAVGAVDPSGILAGFSSRGPASDGDVKPNVAAQGQSSVICDPFGTGTQTGNGTSFASPICCGLVACLYQAHPSFTNMQILQMIQQTASQAAAPDSFLGYGIPDFCAANVSLGGITTQSSTDFLYGISPNPFNDALHFSFYSQTNQNLSIQLFDAAGREILNQYVFAIGNSENHFTLSDLQDVCPGVYFLQVKGESGTYNYKVVKGN
jgi:serine protease AprX